MPMPLHRSASLGTSALLLALLSGAAVAQDSVSRNANGGSGLPGDALSPFSSATQRANYIVDLTSFETSTGTTFGVAPLMKSGRFGTTRFGAINGASSISQTVRTNVTYPAATYSLWNVAGGGVNTSENDQAVVSNITPSGNASVFAAGFMDFDEYLVSSTNIFANQLYGGQIAYDPAFPDRLYVSRINAAVNALNAALDRSQFGYGGVDSDGNIAFRADSFGSAGGVNVLIVGDNYLRVKMPLRNTVVNLIDNNGGAQAAATDWPLQRSLVTHATPTLLPQSVAGRSVMVGADFLGNHKYEGAVNVTSASSAHRPITTDHRGASNVSGATVFAGSVATGAVLTRSAAGTGKTDSLSVFGLAADGNITTARTLTIPSSISDSCDAFQWPIGGGDFRHYDSQVTFRGGSGPVAVTRDQSGRAVASAVVYNGSSTATSNPFNAIAAVRFDPNNPNSTPAWTTIAWVNPVTGTGKELTGDYGADGVPGTGDSGENDNNLNNDAAIGRLAAMGELGGALVGPSLSAPSFDSAGNAYFIAAVALKKRVGPQNPYDFTLALVRGIYNPSTFCYTLEVVTNVGQNFSGRNSARNYQISALNLADADSISTASMWSASASQRPWNNIDNAALDPSDSKNLGGLVLSARITYDTNNDGQYSDPTAIGGDVNSVDEAYNVILYIGNVTTDSAPPCFADYNQDGGVDGADVESFFFDWSQGFGVADVNQDGGVDGADVETFFTQWAAGGC